MDCLNTRLPRLPDVLLGLSQMNRYWIFKQVSIAFFAICVFLFGNYAQASSSWQGNVIFITGGLNQADSICQTWSSAYSGAAAPRVLNDVTNLYCRRIVGSTVYNRYPAGSIMIDLDHKNDFFTQYPDAVELGPDLNPVPTAPDISECTLTDAYFNYGIKQPDGSWLTNPIPDKYYNDGCEYDATPRSTNDGGMCYTFPNSDEPDKGWCILDLTPSTTYNPSASGSPSNSLYPTGDLSTDEELETSTTQQDTKADNLSDWFGSEPTETFNYPDGRKHYRWESSTGCVLEIIANPDGSYQETTDTCNVHTPSSGSVSPDTPPQWEPEQNHTNPDGSPNPGGGSGDNSPSGGGDTGGGDTGGGDTGGGDTGGGDTGGGDGGGDTGGGDTGGGYTGGGDGEGDGEGEGQGFCEYAQIVCDAIDWLTEDLSLPDDEEVPVEELEQPDDWAYDGSAYCPADFYTEVMQGQGLSLTWEPYCELGALLKPFIVGASIFAAALIMLGVRN